MEPYAMFPRAKSILGGVAIATLCGLLMTSCGGFGSTNNTRPGSTPNIQPQTSFRIVGRLGTPFSALISDSRSSWSFNGVIPLSVVIVNNSLPARISVTKLVNDSSLLSVEVINAFTVQQLDSTTAAFGTAVGNLGKVATFAAPASPDVRFFVKGPVIELFDALIEDTEHAEITESRAPTLILFDSPAGGTGGRVDASFTAVNFLGGFSIDLIYDGVLVQSILAGTQVRMKYP
jgi:hypothetical protein